MKRNDGDVAIKPFGKEIFEENYFIKQTPIFNIQIDSFLQYILIAIEDLKVPAKILVDSGAQLSMFRKGMITGEKINVTSWVRFTGITDNELNTLGTMDLKINGIRIEFHVVQDEFKFPYDSILGINCLRKNKLRLDKGY